MSIPLRVLIVEDSENDALLLVRELRRGGYDPIFERVETPEAMNTALDKQPWDIILADYTMPHFSGPSALELLKGKELDIPFILISGTIGEETAVEAVKAGANDYLLKSNLKRLLSAIERELREAKVRRGRKRMEIEYKTILQTAIDGFWVVDAQGNILDVNEAYCRMTGYSRNELLAMRIRDIEAKETPEETARHIQRIMETGSDRFETRHRRKDRSTLDTEISTHYLRDGDNRFFVFLRDITERKRTEEEIRGLSKFPAENPNPVMRIGRNGTILYANQSSTPILTTWGREVGQNVPDDWQKRIAATFESGISKEVEIECNGRIFSYILAPILAEEYVNVYGRDITERKRAEEETQRNLERIRALHEIDRAITSILDLRTILDVLLEKIDLFLPYSAATIRLWNEKMGLLEPVACRNINEGEWKAEEWKGGRGSPNIAFETKATVSIGNCQTDPRVRDHEFFRKNSLVSYLGVPLIVHDHILGVISFYTTTQHEFTSEEIGFLGTLGKQAAIAINNAQIYEQMARANKVKDEFLSVMSHELRTPLNVVVGYTGMIKDGLLGEINPQQQEALEKVISRANDQLVLINNILYATVLDTENINVDMHEVSLRDFLNQLRSGYEAPISKELSFNWDYPPDLPFIRTDSGKLKHILQNLINNAIKFTETGSVTVSAKVKEDQKEVEFKVADTGVGIPKEQLPIIFEKFRQVDSSETRLYGGVGMGLYIVKKFTEFLGGTVHVESHPGQGSTFTVTIPLER